jgi:dephospho-CoA kinase
MNQLVIGLVGEKGSGKQTFSDLLKELANAEQNPSVGSLRICHMRFSDLLRDTLSLWDLPHSRSNLQNLAIAFNKTYGPATLSHAIYKRVQSEPAEIVILDGVRWLSDEELIRSFSKNKMVYITANSKTRFKRLKKRNGKIGEAEMDFNQFSKEENAETETYIPRIGQRSDVKIDNNGTLDELKELVKKFWQSLA